LLPQEELIGRLARICQQDPQLVAAMHYGSFAHGEADEFSDLDIILYFKDATVAKIDQRAWLEQIAPVELFYINEFGNSLAIFEAPIDQVLIRGEFHFDPAGDMAKLEQYRGQMWFPSLETTLIVDKSSALTNHLEPFIGPPPAHDSDQDASYLCDSFLNWFLFGQNLLARGEYARALEVMALVHDNLLRMARLVEGKTHRWITPTRALEKELSPQAYARYQRCTTALEPDALQLAYRNAWAWGNELMETLVSHHSFQLPESLINKIGRRFEVGF
jgi:lincosamide nucleotidyltransferase